MINEIIGGAKKSSMVLIGAPDSGKTIFGKTVEKAQEMLGHYTTIRAIQIDGEMLMHTTDHDINRLNVIVKDGVIVGVSHYG